jgi:hypothetical protein
MLFCMLFIDLESPATGEGRGAEIRVSLNYDIYWLSYEVSKFEMSMLILR